MFYSFANRGKISVGAQNEQTAVLDFSDCAARGKCFVALFWNVSELTEWEVCCTKFTHVAETERQVELQSSIQASVSGPKGSV